jgi:cob(I)alamin adenosyltransferase
VEHHPAGKVVVIVKREGSMELDGRFQIYTGDGKGKSTAALGLAVRAACAGYGVYIGQFMKGRDTSELRLPGLFDGIIDIEQYGSPVMVLQGQQPGEDDVRMARDGLALLEKAMLSGAYDIVIADEINVAQYMGLIGIQDMVRLVDSRPADVELVFTGRHAPEALVGMADLVTEMREVKHYYSTEGLEARRGIEF